MHYYVLMYLFNTNFLKCFVCILKHWVNTFGVNIKTGIYWIY